MKKSNAILAVAAAAVVLAGCKKDDVNKPQSYTVESFDKVEVTGNAKVMFVEEDAEHVENTLHVTSSAETANWIEVKSEDRTLSIVVDEQVHLHDGLTITVVKGSLDEITLEGGDEAEFSLPDERESLTVVTKGQSKLHLTDLRVDRLDFRTTGGSEIMADTYLETHTEAQTYADSRVEQLNDNTLLIDGRYIVYGDAITMTDGLWTVEGSPVTYQYLISESSFSTVGNSSIDAMHAPTRNANVELTGTSEARIWAFGNITGSAVGTSALYYVNEEGVNISSFELAGSAQILPLP